MDTCKERFFLLSITALAKEINAIAGNMQISAARFIYGTLYSVSTISTMHYPCVMFTRICLLSQKVTVTESLNHSVRLSKNQSVAGII